MEVVAESGDFVQGLWLKLLDIIGRDTFTLWVTVPFILTTGLYWIFGGLYLLMDITEKPTFLRKFKIQPGTNEPLDREKLSKLIKRVLFNQFCIGLPMIILNWRVMRDRIVAKEVEVFPSLSRILTDMVVYILLEEIGFYYTHRLLHHRLLYKRIHKTHHEWSSPIAIAAMNCHPIEHAVSNVAPTLLGYLVMRSHPATAWIWFCNVILYTLNDHSNYHFPVLLNSEFHDFHHHKVNNCFGAFGLLDWLHGTDSKYRLSRADKASPVSSQWEKIPDIAKKSL